MWAARSVRTSSARGSSTWISPAIVDRSLACSRGMKPKVVRVLEHDHWAVAEGERAVGPFVLRYRTPVIDAADVGAHVQLVQLVWEFDDAGSGAMPEPGVSDTMQTFEDALCAAWERDGLAYLAAVLTIDGARQWIVYAR